MRKSALAALAVALLLPLGARAALDPRSFDLTVKPQDDFFRYANGAWLKNATMPADVARWGAFDELRERNWQNVRVICERVAARGAMATAVERMVGDFFASGMDETAINAAGLAPLRPELDRIAAVRTPADVMAAIARLKLIGVQAGFAFTGAADAKQSDMVIAQLRQGGLSLPGTGQGSDRDYYINDDEKSQKLRAQYVEHVAKMFELAGDAPASARAGAAAVLRLETELAKVSLRRVELRQPQRNYHKINFSDLPRFTGGGG